MNSHGDSWRAKAYAPANAPRRGLLWSSRRWLVRHRLQFFLVVLLTCAEILYHIRSFSVRRPSEPLDAPFAERCVPPGMHSPVSAITVPPDASQPRENAVMVMLARNSDVDGAVKAVRSLEQQWNRHFHYPYVFLNNKPFSSAFVRALSAEASGHVSFETISHAMWSWPLDADGHDLIDRAHAKKQMQRMAANGLPYAANEDYHHMCRFYSGFFADHPALASYKYFWRVEPEVHYTCAIPYDPFRAMRAAGKRYGYTLALWEVGSTAPSLFRTADEYRKRAGIRAGPAWTSMMDASWAPLPLRWLLMSSAALFHSRTAWGDAWNFCHYWSNFEIADLDFFRSDDYQAFFRELDRAGGFYTERWGDAPVHSLAAALFLEPRELHHFSDIGYVHPPFQHCPPADRGCRCQCDPVMRGVPDTCLNALRRPVDP